MADNNYKNEEIDTIKVVCIPKHTIKKKLNGLFGIVNMEKSRLKKEGFEKLIVELEGMMDDETKSVTITSKEYDALLDYMLITAYEKVAGDMFEWVRREEGVDTEMKLPKGTTIDGVMKMFGLDENGVNITKVNNKKEEEK